MNILNRRQIFYSSFILVMIIFIQQVFKDVDSKQDLIQCLQEFARSPAEVCSPRTNLVYHKTHKTGSSTLINILNRFGDRHQLKFALPLIKQTKIFHHLFSNSTPFNETEVDTYGGAIKRFDVMAAHSVWNLPAVNRVVDPESFRFTILREPLLCFESWFMFYEKFKLYGDINTFATKLKSGELRNIPLEDTQLNDLGFKPGENITKKIEDLDSEFDQVIILEHFEEGLVLLAENICWDLMDMRFLKLNERNPMLLKNGAEMTKETVEFLTTFLADHYTLYQHFLEKHRRLVKEAGEYRIGHQVAWLQEQNRLLEIKCSGQKSIGDCLDFRRNEIPYSYIFRKINEYHYLKMRT